MLFIQTEGAPRSADSMTTVLFIQTEDVTACLHSAVYPNWRCVGGKKKDKNLKVVERFLIEKEFAQGSFLCSIGEPWMMFFSSIYSSEPTPGRTKDVLESRLLNPIQLGFGQS